MLRDVKHRVTYATRYPAVGRVPPDRLFSTRPISTRFGLDRGRPVDRVYIEDFLQSNGDAVKGHVLEVAGDTYARQFGKELESVDILHVTTDNPKATIVADLADAPQIEDARFDCAIITQTLQFIFDVRSAVATLHRIMRRGGTVLATVPSISQVSQYDMVRWGDYWRFTEASIGALFEEKFGTVNVSLRSYGNLLAAIALLHGLAGEELSEGQLMFFDPIYPVVIGVRATKQ